MTKIFCDIADINLIKKFNKKKAVKGFTTNPSLMRKAGAKNYSKYCKKFKLIAHNFVSSIKSNSDHLINITIIKLSLSTNRKKIFNFSKIFFSFF